MADDREPQAAGPGRAPRATRVLLRRGATRAGRAIDRFIRRPL